MGFTLDPYSEYGKETLQQYLTEREKAGIPLLGSEELATRFLLEMEDNR
jgi:hypothetical protein